MITQKEYDSSITKLQAKIKRMNKRTNAVLKVINKYCKSEEGNCFDIALKEVLKSENNISS